MNIFKDTIITLNNKKEGYGEGLIRLVAFYDCCNDEEILQRIKSKSMLLQVDLIKNSKIISSNKESVYVY